MNLKPCPFCGSEAGKFEMVTYIPYIRCTNAFCELSKVKYSERYWNTRPIEDKQAAENQRLKKLLEQALAAQPQKGQDNGTL